MPVVQGEPVPHVRRWPAYAKTVTSHIDENTNHGLHNDTTPRFDVATAPLAWERTMAFFNEHLR